MAQCTATSKFTRERCKRYAGPGERTCHVHGSNEFSKRKAKRVIAQQKAAELLGDDVEPVDDPLSELQALAGRTRAIEQALWRQLPPRDDGTLPDPATVEAYGTAVDRLSRQLAELQRLGLFEMRVSVEQAKVQLLAQALQLVLRDLDLSPRQRAQAPALIRQHLLSLPTGNGCEVTA